MKRGGQSCGGRIQPAGCITLSSHLFIQTYISNITLPPNKLTHTHTHSLPVGLPFRKCWWRDPRGSVVGERWGCLLLEFGSASCVGRWRGRRVFRQRSNGLQTVRITVLSHAEGARAHARSHGHVHTRLNRRCRSLVWTGNIWQPRPRRRQTARRSADESRF